MNRKLPVLLGLVALAFGALAYAFLRPPPLPRYGHVPDFVLDDQAGQHVSSRTLAGKPWVADFFFTSCSGVCPMLEKRMAAVGQFLDENHVKPSEARLVSISVDPERDTPQKLGEYSKRFARDADLRRWSFLTGPEKDIERAAIAGFKMGLSRERPGPGEPPGDGEDGMAILHGSRLILVDQQGAIRGYYESDEQGVADLERDLLRLVRTGPQ